MTARNEPIAARLREVRAALEITQAQMAARMRVKLRAYQTYEAGERQPRASDLAPLTEVGIDLNWLLAGTGQMRRAAPAAPPGPIDEQMLAETLRLVEDWLAAHRRTMTPARKAEVAASIYAMAVEDAAAGRPAVDERRVAQILKLVG